MIRPSRPRRGREHTDAQMGVDRGITSSTSQVLVLSVWDVEVSLWVAVLLSQTKVDDIDLVSALANTHQEVVGLDVTVNEGLGMNVLDAGDELIGKEEHGLQGELAVTEVEQIFQTGTKEVKDHGIVVTLGTEPANEGDADTARERLVDTGFVFELGVLSLDTLELDGNLFTGDNVGSQVDVAERTATDLAADAVLVADTEILDWVLARCPRSCVW